MMETECCWPGMMLQWRRWVEDWNKVNRFGVSSLGPRVARVSADLESVERQESAKDTVPEKSHNPRIQNFITFTFLYNGCTSQLYKNPFDRRGTCDLT
jgi:hypothetical protein